MARWSLLERDCSRVVVDHVVITIIQRGVVCHTVECLCALKGEDIFNAMWVVLDPAIAPEVSNSVDKGLASVGPNGDRLVDTLDVGGQIFVAENIHGGLVVE